MERENGKAEKTTARLEGCIPSPQSEGLGGVPGNSKINGTNALTASECHCTRGNSPGGYGYDRCTPIGKILQRLELVERSYIDYVRADQTRLEARLDESKNLEQLFQQSVAELRQEIYNLATESESNESGHNNS